MRLVCVLANLLLLSVVGASENAERTPTGSPATSAASPTWILVEAAKPTDAPSERQPTVSQTSEPDEVFVEAVIVGAGWAGISTARDLKNSGYSSLLILEANGYVGGRSTSNNSDGTLNVPPADLPSNNVPIELGSEWLYQTVPESQYTYLLSDGFLSSLSDETLTLGVCGANALTSFYRQTGSSPGQSELVPDTEVNSLESNPWRSYNSFKSSCSSSHEQCKQEYFNSQNLSSLQRQYLNLIIGACGGLETVSLQFTEIQIVVCALTI